MNQIIIPSSKIIKHSILLFLWLLLFSCEHEEEQAILTEEETEEEQLILTEDLISTFSVKIVLPDQKRDYSNHNDGTSGIFENPEEEKYFEGNIEISLINGEIIAPSEFKVEWYSNIDSTLLISSPNTNMNSEFTTKLSKGLHWIYFKVSAYSNPSLFRIDSIYISNVIALNSSPTGKSLLLNWTEYEGTDFLSYLIYKSSNEPIEIQNQNITSYEDFDVNIVDSITYQVVVKRATESEMIYGSNILKDRAGILIKIDHYISKLISDPKRDFVYGIVNPGLYNYDSEYGLFIFNTSNNNLEITKHFYPNTRFDDLDISIDGESLFLCSSSKIIQLDLNTFTIIKEISLTRPAHKLEIGNNNMLYYHVTPPTSGSTPLIIMDYETEQFYSSNQPYKSEFRHGDIEFNSNNNMLYHGQSNTSSGNLIRYDVSSGQAVSQEPQPHYSYPNDFLLISPDGNSVFWQYSQYDKDLTLIRSLDARIVSCSNNSNLIADSRSVYSLADYSLVLEFPSLPIGDLKGVCFSNSDDSVVLFSSDEPYYQSYQTYLAIMNILD